VADKYKVQSTSRQSAKVEDRVLSQTTKTRRIVRPLIVENPNDPQACVKISIIHQRAVNNGEFEDISSEPLSRLKAGEIGKLILDTAETKKLSEELQKLYAIYQEKGLPQGARDVVVGFENEIVRTDSKRAHVIRSLIEQGHSEQVWEQLVALDPDLITRLSMARLHDTRSNGLRMFEAMLCYGEHSEIDWQKFFEQNTWIFGYGLSYKFLRNITTQPSYGGKSVMGCGENRGDFLRASEGSVRFTVLVEIKKPQSELLAKLTYRNDVYVPGQDLTGGVSQLRVNGRRWETEESRTDRNREDLDSKDIHTVSPKLILVVGDTKQLASRPHRESFELFRRGQGDVEILTFDEVYERAKHIVTHNT
jgi:hypothetical protein